MKLIRVGPPGRERPGVELDDGTRLDVSSHFADYDGAFLAAGGIDRLRALVRERRDWPRIDPGERLGPPVARPGKFIAIGQNYKLHIEETGAPMPTEPAVFTKFTSCICGPYDEVRNLPGAEQLDYEVELAFVVKEPARFLRSEGEAMDYVAGFMVCNDVSERILQRERGGQWVKGKSADTFGPLGPWLVPTEDLPNFDRLALRLSVNDQERQNSTTADMLFKVPFLVHYLSQFCTLEPGDVVTTGTPSGVAIGRNDFPFLKDGDVMKLSIEGLGTQQQRVRPA